MTHPAIGGITLIVRPIRKKTQLYNLEQKLNVNWVMFQGGTFNWFSALCLEHL